MHSSLSPLHSVCMLVWGVAHEMAPLTFRACLFMAINLLQNPPQEWCCVSSQVSANLPCCREIPYDRGVEVKHSIQQGCLMFNALGSEDSGRTWKTGFTQSLPPQHTEAVRTAESHFQSSCMATQQCVLEDIQGI